MSKEYHTGQISGKGKILITKQELDKITKYKINNFDYIKFKSFCTNKKNATKIRRETTNWEKIFITNPTHCVIFMLYMLCEKYK